VMPLTCTNDLVTRALSEAWAGLHYAEQGARRKGVLRDGSKRPHSGHRTAFAGRIRHKRPASRSIRKTCSRLVAGRESLRRDITSIQVIGHGPTMLKAGGEDARGSKREAEEPLKRRPG
jgi:hypothetical protein